MDIWHTIEYPLADYVSGAAAKPVGYGFYDCFKKEDDTVKTEILLLNRKNPFMTGNKSLLFVPKEDCLTTYDDPLLDIALDAGLLYIDGVCYFLNPNIEKDFGLEDRNVQICEQRMELIAEASIISDYEQLEAVAVKSARKFVDFDNAILDHIVKYPLPPETIF